MGRVETILMRLASGNVLVFDSPEELALAAVERFVSYAKDAWETHGIFSVSLAGGQTPKRVYEILAAEWVERNIEWARVHLFFGDERGVPPTHTDSNFRMVYETLISKVPLPENNVHRIRGEIDPAESALEYEQELKAFFSESEWPRFNLVLLGMGADGHTASIFPDEEIGVDESRWVVNTKQGSTGYDRITLTLPVFNHASHVIFLVAGKEKAARLHEVLTDPSANKKNPAAAIRPLAGALEWLVDSEAAALL